MAVSLGRLRLAITLGTAEFSKSANKINQSWKGMVRKMRQQSKVANAAIVGISKTVKGLGKALGAIAKVGAVAFGALAAGAAGYVAALKAVGDKYEELQIRANEFGMSLQDLDLLEAMSDAAFGNADKLADFFKDAREKIGIAINEGSGEGFEALKLLGLDPQGFKDIDEAMGPVIAKMKELNEAQRRAIGGMFAGVGADLTLQELNILDTLINRRKEAAEAFRGMFGDAATQQQALDAATSIGRITRVLTQLKDRVLTSEWMNNILRFAENFSLALARMDMSGWKELWEALKADLKTIAIYFKDIMLWAGKEFVMGFGPMLDRAITKAVMESEVVKWIQQTFPGTLGKLMSNVQVPAARQGAPMPTAGAFRTPQIAAQMARQGDAIRQAQDRIVAAPSVPSGGNIIDLDARRRNEEILKMEQASLKFAEKWRDQTELLAAIAENTLATKVQSGLMAGIQGGRDGFLNFFKTQMLNKVMMMLSGGIAKALGGMGGVGGFIGKLFGAQHGADFDVGGRHGVDQNVVAFRASRGERVRVETREQQRSGGAMVVNNNISFAGANIRAASEEELESVGRAAANGAVGRMSKMRRYGRF